MSKVRKKKLTQKSDPLGEEYRDYSYKFEGVSDREVGILGGALLDDRLLQLINSFTINDADVSFELFGEQDSPLQSFGSKIKIAFSLGLITREEYKSLDIIREIRNLFAHEFHQLTFSSDSIDSKCKKLSTSLGHLLLVVPTPLTSKDYFTYAIHMLQGLLFTRIPYALKERRKERPKTVVRSINL